MGFYDRNEPLIISYKFQYLQLRDPRKTPAQFEDVVPSYRPNKAGEEFLKKYLALVRTRFERTTVAEWSMYLAGKLPEFEELVEDQSNSENFVGFMVQGFAMAVCEDVYFKIAKPELMSECAWEAMRSMQTLQAMNDDDFSGEICLNAMLAGYLIAREFKASHE
jgi:hypothetical protein